MQNISAYLHQNLMALTWIMNEILMQLHYANTYTYVNTSVAFSIRIWMHCKMGIFHFVVSTFIVTHICLGYVDFSPVHFANINFLMRMNNTEKITRTRYRDVKSGRKSNKEMYVFVFSFHEFPRKRENAVHFEENSYSYQKCWKNFE